MLSPRRTITLDAGYLEGIEHRLLFLSDALFRATDQEELHAEGVAEILRDIARDLFTVVHADERPTPQPSV